MSTASLTFDFNMEKVKQDGLTTDELLAPMREHAKKYGIDEPEYGVFTMTGENAMCAIGLFVVNITKKDHNYISYLNTWLYDVCGEVEDCVDSVKRWYVKDGILPPEAYVEPVVKREPKPDLVSLTFDFNKEKVERDGFTTDDLLAPMREHAKKYGIDEPEYGVFTMSGENAMCCIGMFVVDITDANHAYVSYLNTWLFDVCGKVEDCVITTKELYAEEGIELLDTMTSVNPNVVSLTFDFNKEKVERDGFTTDDLLAPMREHAKKYGIDEPEYGVFTMSGENAMCCIGMFVVDITDVNHAYVSYLNTWLFDVCGDVEDCIAFVKRRYAKKGIKVLDTMTSVI